MLQWSMMIRLITDLKELRINECWMLSHQWVIYITPSKAQKILQKGLKKKIRERGSVCVRVLTHTHACVAGVEY